MTTINDFINENNLTVTIEAAADKYDCYICGKEGTFKFSMTRKKILEHMKRFCPKDFVEHMINDEKMVRTHFRRLAVTWWHITVMSDERAMEIK